MLLAVMLNLILNFDNLMKRVILTWKTFAMICEDLLASLVVSRAYCYVDNYWMRLTMTSWNELAKLQMRISPCPSLPDMIGLDFPVWP